MRIEEFDQLGEVGERAGQPVDLVDDDHVDSARANVIQQLLERWPTRGSRPSTAALIMPGERNASDKVIRVERSVLPSRKASASKVRSGSDRSSSSQR